MTFGLTGNPVQSRLIAWDDVAADRVDMTIQVRRPEADDVTCVLRAQDVNRIDVGYAEVVIPAGEPQVLLDYSLRTIAPAYTAELLGLRRRRAARRSRRRSSRRASSRPPSPTDPPLPFRRARSRGPFRSLQTGRATHSTGGLGVRRG